MNQKSSKRSSRTPDPVTGEPAAPKKPRARKSVAPRAVAHDMDRPLSEVTSEQIAMRAYELFLADGQVHGRDITHWLAAERELLVRPK